LRLSVAAATVMGAAVPARRTPARVTPPLLDLHVAVNFVTAGPWFAPAAYVTMIGPDAGEIV
jgi:hypothetical protein